MSKLLFATVCIFIFSIQSNIAQKSRFDPSGTHYTIGGSVMYSEHAFLRKTRNTRFVFPLEESASFASFGHQLSLSYSMATNSSWGVRSFSVSGERAFGKRELESGSHLHIEFSRFELNVNHGGPHPKMRRVSGSFGYGAGFLYGTIRNAWEGPGQIKQGYEADFIDYGLNSNLQANYHLKRLTLLLKMTTSYHFKNQIIGLSASIGAFARF